MNAWTTFVTIAGNGAGWLLDWSWQAVVLLAGVWLGLTLWRTKAPALRHQIWLFTLVAVSVLPLGTTLAQRFPLPRPASPALSYVIEVPRVIFDTVPQATEQTLPAAALVESPMAFSSKVTAKPFPVLPLLFAVWVLGTMVTLLRVLKSHARLLRVLKLGQSVHPADLGCSEFETLMTGKVHLRLSPEVHSPILCGVFRPVILLPADIAAWTSSAERAAMIQHELAHVERRDSLVNLFQTSLHVIFFFHPLVRYACRQLSLEREIACDDRVVGLGAVAEAYATGILKVAERSISAVGTPSGVHQLALFSAKQLLERRIEMILNTNRVRIIAHQWRYLILPVALIAVAGFLLIPRYSAKNLSSASLAKSTFKPAKSSPVKKTYSRQEQELIELIQQVAAVIPQQWHGRYFRSGLPEERLVLDDFRLYDKRNSLTIIPPHPSEIPGPPDPPYSIPQVELRDFEVSINDDSAVIDFIGTLHLSVPGNNQEVLQTDPYRVKLVKVNDQWQADRQNRMPWVGAMFWPPPPPRPPVELQGPWAEAQRAAHGLSIVNNGEAEFSVTAESSSTPAASEELSELEHRFCRCSAQPVQNVVMKLGQLELRGQKGIRFSHAENGTQMLNRDGSKIFAMDSVHFKDRFELQWGEQTYYGSGSVKASYHLQNKRLGIGSFPETGLYRTPDRTGEAITLQQLAQELKDQALRKN